MQIENVILENLIHNEEYTRRVLPFLKDEYFHEKSHAIVFGRIADHMGRFNTPPTQDELLVELANKNGLSQGDFEQSVDLVNTLAKRHRAPALEWLLQHTESFCQEKAVYNAVVKAATMIDGNKKDELGSIPDVLKDALSVSFDTNIGHDFQSQIKERYKTLHLTTEYKIPFDIDYLNEITVGGLPRKTLSVIAASTGAGKSLFMCHAAAHNLLKGYNVLYISMEMAEERISERIDANILNIPIQDLAHLSMQEYEKRLTAKLGDTKGRLIVKEYPTASAGAPQFRALLNELRLKKDFKPDIIYLDYLNICSSGRFRSGDANSYQLIKAVTEEIRGLAIEYDVPIVSATQFNRGGQGGGTDVSLTEISDSSGISMTADMLLAMIRSEELDEQNVVMFKQLKNRFSDMASKLRFVVGIDRSRMKLFNSDGAATNVATKRDDSHKKPSKPTVDKYKETVVESVPSDEMKSLNKPSFGSGRRR